MIQLSNGHSFEYVAASGALAYDGQGWPWEWPFRWLGLIDPSLFTIVTKTLTAQPKAGNLRWLHPWTCVKSLSKGVVNAIGLTNPGLDWWLSHIAPRLKKLPYSSYSLVCSITEDNPQILREMVLKLDSVPIKAIEFNASCPNTHQEIHSNTQLVVKLARLLCQNSRHPIFIKLSATQDYLQIAKQLETQVQALAINSVPWSLIFPNQASPLQKLGGGGVSGKIAQKFTWKMVEELAGHTTIPVMGPGVWDYEDLATLRKLGAKAFSFGSIFMCYPWRPTSFIQMDRCENGG
ncbi:MAG: hypothetical protein HQM15_11055 [Deltaproteobacteria bacterium]|nr:hypothetical protein [Deltaproteobacteria bacterium]